MELSNYQHKCLRSEPSNSQYKSKNIEVRCMHHIMGMVTEVGELTDAFKKHTIYGKALDIENVREELGDLMWYVCGLANAMGFGLELVLEENYLKLLQRYPEKFSEEDAISRKDKSNGDF